MPKVSNKDKFKQVFKSGFLHRIENLIKQDPKCINYKIDGLPPLISAIIVCNLKAFNLLLEHNVNSNKTDAHGYTALFFALIHGQSACVERLLSKKIRFHRDDRKNDLLQIAFEGNLEKLLNEIKEVDEYCKEHDDLSDKIDMLLVASARGHVSFIKFLLANGITADKQGAQKITALHAAACNNQYDTVEFILARSRESLSVCSEHGLYLMHSVARVGHVHILHLLTQFDVSPITRTEIGFIPLIFAAQAGHLPAVMKLHSLSISKPDTSLPVHGKEYLAALYFAAINGHAEVVVYLVESVKVPLNIFIEELGNPLVAATAANNEKVVRYLLEQAPNLFEEINPRSGFNPFLKAVREGHLTLIQYYYKNYKPNLFDKGKQKLTILHLVIESENMEALNWFLKRNDELKEQGKDLLKERDDTKDSLTPFLFAIEAGHYEMAKRLCEYDPAILQQVDAHNRPATWLAVIEGHLKILILLGLKGLPLDEEVSHGERYTTLLHLAAINGREDIIKFLLLNFTYWTNINALDEYNRTPLQVAVNNKDTAVIDLLLVCGAGLNANMKLVRPEDIFFAKLSLEERCVTIALQKAAHIYFMGNSQGRLIDNFEELEKYMGQLRLEVILCLLKNCDDQIALYKNTNLEKVKAILLKYLIENYSVISRCKIVDVEKIGQFVQLYKRNLPVLPFPAKFTYAKLLENNCGFYNCDEKILRQNKQAAVNVYDSIRNFYPPGEIEFQRCFKEFEAQLRSEKFEQPVNTNKQTLGNNTEPATSLSNPLPQPALSAPVSEPVSSSEPAVSSVSGGATTITPTHPSVPITAEPDPESASMTANVPAAVEVRSVVTVDPVLLQKMKIAAERFNGLVEKGNTALKNNKSLEKDIAEYEKILEDGKAIVHVNKLPILTVITLLVKAQKSFTELKSLCVACDINETLNEALYKEKVNSARKLAAKIDELDKASKTILTAKCEVDFERSLNTLKKRIAQKPGAEKKLQQEETEPVEVHKPDSESAKEKSKMQVVAAVESEPRSVQATTPTKILVEMGGLVIKRIVKAALLKSFIPCVEIPHVLIRNNSSSSDIKQKTFKLIQFVELVRNDIRKGNASLELDLRQRFAITSCLFFVNYHILLLLMPLNRDADVSTEQTKNLQNKIDSSLSKLSFSFLRIKTGKEFCDFADLLLRNGNFSRYSLSLLFAELGANHYRCMNDFLDQFCQIVDRIGNMSLDKKISCDDVLYHMADLMQMINLIYKEYLQVNKLFHSEILAYLFHCVGYCLESIDSDFANIKKSAIFKEFLTEDVENIEDQETFFIDMATFFRKYVEDDCRDRIDEIVSFFDDIKVFYHSCNAEGLSVGKIPNEREMIIFCEKNAALLPLASVFYQGYDYIMAIPSLQVHQNNLQGIYERAAIEIRHAI